MRFFLQPIILKLRKPKAWVIFILAFFLFLLALEGGFQLFASCESPYFQAPQGVSLHENEYRTLPDSSFSYGSVSFPLHHFGLRGSLPKEQSLPIFLFGSDSVFGGRIQEQAHTLSHKLEKILKQDMPQVQVINAGLPHARLQTHLMQLPEILPSLSSSQPVSVLFFLGYEEVFALLSPPQIRKPLSSYFQKPDLLERSAFYRFLSSQNGSSSLATDVSSFVPISSSGVQRKYLKNITAQLHKCIKLCQEQGAGLLFVTAPSIYAYEREHLKKKLEHKTFQEAYAELKTLLQNIELIFPHVSFYDLQNEMKKEDQALSASPEASRLFLPYDPILGYGLSPAGTRMAARFLHEALYQKTPWVFK